MYCTYGTTGLPYIKQCTHCQDQAGLAEVCPRIIGTMYLNVVT